MKPGKNVIKITVDTMREVGLRQIATIAAATAFWFFLSLVPIVILCVALLPLVSATQEQLLRYVSVLFPSSFNDLLAHIVTDIYEGHRAVVSLSILAVLWSGGVGFSSLFRGLEEIYGVEHRYNYFLRQGRGILYAVGMTLSIVLSILLMGFGRRLARLITHHIPRLTELFILLLKLRYLVVLVVLTLFFMIIFKYSTRSRPRFARTFPGALFAALLWIGLSQLMSLWVNSFGGYNTYGSLATVIVVMLWLYYCTYILLICACLNSALATAFPKKLPRREKKSAS